jgi:metal-dependent amidase/aminoacylase/carboxypeptidase family protein
MNEELANKYSSSLSEAADGDFFEARVPRTGAEDFSFFAQQVQAYSFFWESMRQVTRIVRQTILHTFMLMTLLCLME